MLSAGNLGRLVAHCEACLGRRLAEIRRRLAAPEWLGALWELLLIDAACAVAPIEYESRSGGGRPDLLVKPAVGDPFWIEATYRTVGHDPEEIEKTSLYRSLDAKRAQIAKWELDKPCVLCIGGAADAGFSAHRQPMSAEQSAWAFFEDEGGEFISAVVAAPIEIEPEMFTGLKRKAKPRLIENGHAAHRLGNSERETLLRLDFNRWPYSLISQRDVDERSQALAWADERPGYRVEHRDRFDGGCWEFQQGFDLLRIVPRDGLVLLLRRSEIVGEYPSPEQAATMAASLFSMGPPLVFIYERARRERRELYAPVSIEQNRAIVSSDLRAWRWRPGRSA